MVLSYSREPNHRGASIRRLNLGTWGDGELVVQPTVLLDSRLFTFTTTEEGTF